MEIFFNGVIFVCSIRNKFCECAGGNCVFAGCIEGFPWLILLVCVSRTVRLFFDVLCEFHVKFFMMSMF